MDTPLSTDHERSHAPHERAEGDDDVVPHFRTHPVNDDQLRQTLLEYRAILENASVGIAFTRERRFQHANPRFEEMFGWPVGSLAGQPGSVVWATQQQYAEIGRLVGPELARGLPVDLVRPMARRDGTIFQCRLRARALDPSHPAQGGTIWISEDVTEYQGTLAELREARDGLEQRVRERTTELAQTNARLRAEIGERELAEDRVRHLALHDALTGLPNRRLLEERLDEAIAAARLHTGTASVMFIDLDRFKTINDSLGHAVGDRLLQAVSERLSECLRPIDTVSRVGGDEFVLVLPQLDSVEAASQVAARILDSLSVPYTIDGTLLRVTPSIGISMYPADGTTARELIGNADSAMYQAKATGRRTIQFYRAPDIPHGEHRFMLESDLHGALERGELQLYYQPRVDLRTEAVTGCEALLRWLHPMRGLVSPADFIPVAEDTGMIAPIGQWVVREICAQNRRWRDAGLRAIPISINLSARQFRDDGGLESIPAILHQNGLEPAMLEVEITESVLMHHREQTVAILTGLSEIGVSISIDDFGTGYSNLAHLKRFPLDVLKIDQTFVRDATHSSDDAAIVQAIIGLAHTLGLRVVAEGVETAEQRAFLKRAGCDEAQGFLFARPMPAAGIERLLAHKERAPA